MIRVQAEDFDVGTELTRMNEQSSGSGAVCSFVGRVREVSAGAAITAMTLEHYPGMTERVLARLEADAAARWPLQNTLIIHRYGRLEPGAQIVLVAVASAHRDAAFEACRFLIDQLKTIAPFWKAEESGTTRRWVDTRTEDDAAAARWRRDSSAGRVP